MPVRKSIVQYIEDDPDIRAIVEMAMELEPDLQLHAAPPAADVLGSIRALQPDLVILDVMMPDIDGISIARDLRADAGLCHIPFAFMTAKAMPQEQAQMRALGACAIIFKPFDPLGLAAQIRGLLERVRNE